MSVVVVVPYVDAAVGRALQALLLLPLSARELQEAGVIGHTIRLVSHIAIRPSHIHAAV